MTNGSVCGLPWQVRIAPAAGQPPSGGGLLYSDHQIITCAHVVGTEPPPITEPTPIVVDFPFLGAHTPIRAEVVHWCPADSDGHGDVAVLKLCDQPPPRAKPARLYDVTSLHNHRFRAYGYPEGHDNGVWVHGQIIGPAGHEWIQLECDGEYDLTQGFSGAPVYVTDIDAVVGLITTVDRQPTLRAGFSIGLDALRNYCPDLPQPAITTFLLVRDPHGKKFTTMPLRGDCIHRTKVTIGRQVPGYEPDIALHPGRRVSRDHCQLDFEGRRWRLSDNDSSNGTFLRRSGCTEITRVAEPVQLRGGDVICLFSFLSQEGHCEYWELEFVDQDETT